MRRVLELMSVCCLSAFGLTACDDGGGGDPQGPGGGAGGVDGGVGAPIPPGVEVVPFDTRLPADLTLDALGEAGVRTACAAVGAYEAQFAAELQPLRCKEFGVSTAVVGAGDPQTCLRLTDTCLTVPYRPDFLADRCVTAFDNRRNWCQPSTVAEFEACVARNVGIERAAAENAELSCLDGIDAGTVLPDGLWDCACNVPLLLGPAPEDDPDRDGVLTPDDRCPGTGPYAEVGPTGCSALQDRDQDGVPNLDDACPDSNGPGTPQGCDAAQDPDQDGVLPPQEICPGTAPGAVVSARGCSVAQDDDQDDVPDAIDPCPGSNPDLPINGAGCDSAQDLDNDGVANADDRCPGSAPGLNPTGCDAQQDVDSDGVPNAEDLCPDSFPQVTGSLVNAQGCTPSQDRDADGVPNTDDLCPSTPADEIAQANGCSEREDIDGDGVHNADDACPMTPDGQPVDRDGCSDLQHGTRGWAVDTLPEDARTFTFQRTPDQPPINLYASERVVTEQDGNRNVQGTLYLGLPDGSYLPMPRADVWMPEGDDPREILSIRGSVDFVLPGLPGIPGIEIDEPARVSVRLQFGDAILDDGHDLPVAPDRPYLVLTGSAGFSGRLGPIELSVGPRFEGVVVVDPFDPGFIGRFDIQGVPFISRVRNAGLGVSMTGALPFEPFDDGVISPNQAPIEPFDGHVRVEGSLQLGELVPLPGVVARINGRAVVDLDPFEEGTVGINDRARVGATGELTVGCTPFEGLELTIPIARGTVLYNDPRHLKPFIATGDIGPNALRFPIELPFEQPFALSARVEAGRSIEDLSVTLGGILRVPADAFRQWGIPIDINPIDVEGGLTLGFFAVTLNGTTNRSPLDSIRFNGEVTVTATLLRGPGSAILLTGPMEYEGRVARFIRIDGDGIEVD